MTVPESKLFGRQVFTASSRNRNGRSLRARYQLQAVAMNLYIASGHIGVAPVRRTCHYGSAEENHVLRSEFSCTAHYFLANPRRIKRHLHDAFSIAQVQEEKPSQVAHTMNPTGQLHGCAGVFGTKRSSEVRPKGGRGPTMFCHVCG